MKKTITKEQQAYINSLLKKRRERQIEKVFSKEQDKERMSQYDHDNKIGSRCDGMTYLEIEQLNNTYNNFR